MANPALMAVSGRSPTAIEATDTMRDGLIEPLATQLKERVRPVAV